MTTAVFACEAGSPVCLVDNTLRVGVDILVNRLVRRGGVMLFLAMSLYKNTSGFEYLLAGLAFKMSFDGGASR